MRPLGWLLLTTSLLSALGAWLQLDFPTVSAPFRLTRNNPTLHLPNGTPWLAWLLVTLGWLTGLTLLIQSHRHRANPLTLRRRQHFRSIKRGYYSLLILLGLILLAALDFILIGHEALAIRYQGQWTFPAFTSQIEKGQQYGLTGDHALTEPNYRALARQFRTQNQGNLVILPLHPYSPTRDRIPATALPLTERPDGLVYQNGQPFNGLASYLHNPHQPERQHLRYRYRNGKREGRADGWTPQGQLIYHAQYQNNQLIPGTNHYQKPHPTSPSEQEFLTPHHPNLVQVDYSPSPPSLTHPLGTDSSGNDLLAYLYGGLQINIQAALVYIPLVYTIGITIGLLMGYFGGTFDLLIQRLIEILSNLPFLFIIMIVSTIIPPDYKERAGLWIIIAILITFNWMGMTYLMRTAALKEKARDYVSAARVLGASTPRILLRHLLPNSIAIIITLIPFSISSLITSLASLDYLGFGLPPRYPTWGRLLRDGLDNYSSPWLVTTAFLALTTLLILITFIGEAVREAYDPKKHTYYQ